MGGNGFNYFAAIDIGSYSMKMKIAEVGPDGGIKTLETLRRIINLGRDTFNIGMIRHENVEEICEVLDGFKSLAREYGVGKYRIVATSALREASNCDFILDFIRMKTGYAVEIISESEERFYTYNAIGENLPDFTKLKQEGVLIADIGSGGVEITLFNKGNLIFTQYVKIGSLRLKEVLSNLERRTLNFPNLIGEFLESEIDILDVFLQKSPIRNFIGIGAEIGDMHDLLSANKAGYKKDDIEKKDFNMLYRMIVGKSRQQIAETYNMDTANVETLVPAMMVFDKLLSYTRADRVYTPMVSLCDGLIRNMADMKYGIENRSLSESDIVMLVKKLGDRYCYNAKHAGHVEDIALKLFDSSGRLHGYSDRERLLLQIAAIAHDFGKYVNIKAHNLLSHDIILNSEILGLSRKDTLIAANVVKYHSFNMPSMEDPSYASLDHSDRILISKLAAFLKIAEALDKSHKQKISGIKVAYNGSSFTIKAGSSQDTLLEEWEFENKSSFFKEVFGIEPVLQVKRK